MIAAGGAALLLLGFALIPAHAIPWYRMSMVLDYHREQLAVVGVLGLLVSGILFALVFFAG